MKAAGCPITSSLVSHEAWRSVSSCIFENFSSALTPKKLRSNCPRPPRIWDLKAHASRLASLPRAARLHEHVAAYAWGAPGTRMGPRLWTRPPRGEGTAQPIRVHAPSQTCQRGLFI